MSTTTLLPPLPFEKNHHGHYIVHIKGKDFPGIQEILLLKKKNFPMRLSALKILLTKGKSSYDAAQHMASGKSKKCALVPYLRLEDRTTAGYLDYGRREFGYGKVRAGALFRVLEQLQPHLPTMEGHDCHYLAPLHGPLQNHMKHAMSLCVRHYPDGWMLTGTDGDLSHEWRDPGILIYDIP